jgi:hypothetical protein
MNKRSFLGMAAGPITIIAAAIGIGKSVVAEAATKSNTRNSVTWNVPEGVDKIRVRSWTPDGKPDLDRVLSVEPNQTFRIDVVK